MIESLLCSHTAIDASLSHSSFGDNVGVVFHLLLLRRKCFVIIVPPLYFGLGKNTSDFTLQRSFIIEYSDNGLWNCVCEHITTIYIRNRNIWHEKLFLFFRISDCVKVFLWEKASIYMLIVAFSQLLHDFDLSCYFRHHFWWIWKHLYNEASCTYQNLAKRDNPHRENAVTAPCLHKFKKKRKKKEKPKQIYEENTFTYSMQKTIKQTQKTRQSDFILFKSHF